MTSEFENSIASFFSKGLGIKGWPKMEWFRGKPKAWWVCFLLAGWDDDLESWSYNSMFVLKNSYLYVQLVQIGYTNIDALEAVIIGRSYWKRKGLHCFVVRLPKAILPCLGWKM